jgi:hypothetical protein
MSETSAPIGVEEEPQAPFPDLSTLAGFPPPPESPPFQPYHSEFIEAVFSANGVLLSLNGGFALNTTKLTGDLKDKTVPDRVVGENNLDQLPDLGYTKGDMLYQAWNVDSSYTVTHPVECDWLKTTAYRLLTPHGPVSNLLPKGTVMVETGTKELTREMLNKDGSPTTEYVVVRAATTVPERCLAYRVNPVAVKARNYFDKAIKAILESREEFPDAEELWVGAFQALNQEFGGLMAGGLREMGLGYKPAEITMPKSKKAAAE